MKLLPGMAEWNLQRPESVHKYPVVTASDEAALPLNDGRWLRVLLVGPQVPGLDATERVRWSSIDVSFNSHKSRARAILNGSFMKLQSGEICLTLGVPEEATVQSLVEDHATIRIARIFSLVVNRRGEKYAEVLTIHDVEGESSMFKQECEIEISEDRKYDGTDETRMLGSS
jgi:hypothetical protein